MNSQRGEAAEGRPIPVPAVSGVASETTLVGSRTTLSVIPREEAEGSLHSEEELRRMDITSSLIRVEVTEVVAEDEATAGSTSNCKVLRNSSPMLSSMKTKNQSTFAEAN